MEAYAAYALRVWLAPPAGLSKLARRYAACSALGALTLGAAGQVTYHLMQAAGLTVAPWQITTFVSCLPVAVLAAAAALYHLVHNVRQESLAVEQVAADETPQDVAVDDTPTTPLPRVEAAAELPASETSGESRDKELYEQVELDLAACETKREQLLVAWKYLGVEVPETTDVMPALVWLSEHGVHMDKSGAYDIARKLRQKATSRPVQLAAVGGGR
jgi:hypothetical protein